MSKRVLSIIGLLLSISACGRPEMNGLPEMREQVVRHPAGIDSINTSNGTSLDYSFGVTPDCEGIANALRGSRWVSENGAAVVQFDQNRNSFQLLGNLGGWRIGPQDGEFVVEESINRRGNFGLMALNPGSMVVGDTTVSTHLLNVQANGGTLILGRVVLAGIRAGGEGNAISTHVVNFVRQ